MELLGMYITAGDMSIIMFAVNAAIFVMLLLIYLKLRREY